MPKILTRLRIDEVSSVDRGAGEGVKIMLMKRNEDQPMAQPSSLSKIFSKLFGGGEDNSVVIDKSVQGLAESITSILSDDKVDHAVELGKTFDQFSEHLKSTLTAGPAVIEKKDTDMDIAVLKKSLGLADTATEAEVTKAITDQQAVIAATVASVKKLENELILSKAEFTPAESDFYKAGLVEVESDTKKAFREASHAERTTIMKSAEPPLPVHVQKIMDDNEALRKRLEVLEAGGSLASVTKMATEAGLPETEAATVQSALKGDVKAVEKLLGFIKTAQAAAEEGGVFKEFGTAHGAAVTGKAYDELMAKAEELRKGDPKLTQAAAFAKVYEDPANIAIVRRERGENRPN